MTILFAGNDFSAYAPQGDAFWETGTEVRDPDYADGEMHCTDKGARLNAEFASPIQLGGEVWCQIKMRIGDHIPINNQTADGMVICLTDNSNPTALIGGMKFDLDFPAGGGEPVRKFRIFYGTDTIGGFTQQTAYREYNAFTNYTITVNAVLDPVVGRILVYIDGVLAHQYYGETTVSGQITEWTGMFHEGSAAVAFSGFDASIWYSEGIASTTSTLGQRVASLRPNANGPTFQWSGTFDNVDDGTVDEGTSISSDTANDRYTVEFANMQAGIPSDAVIAAVVNSIRAADNASANVTGFEHIVRTGGVDYSGPQKSLSAATSIDQEIWEINPDTGQRWTKAEIDAVAAGLIARA